MGVVIRQSIKGTIVTYIGAFIGFVNTIFIATKFLTPEVIGLNRILIEAATLLTGLSQLGVGVTGIRFFPYFKTKDGKNKGFFYYLCILPLFGLTLFGFLYFLLQQPIGNYFAKESPLFFDYYFWVFPLTFMMVYMAVFETYGNVLMRITIPKMVREIGVRIFVILSTLAYAFELVNLNGFVVLLTISYALATLINLLYVLFLHKPNGFIHPKKDIPKPLLKEISSYSVYCLFFTLVSLLSMRIDVFMVSAKMGLEYTAIFSIAYYMAAIIEMPSRSMLAISGPLMAEASKNKDKIQMSMLFKKVSLHLFFAASFILFLLWININNVYEIMPNGEYYKAGLSVVLLVSLVKVVESITNVGQQLLVYSRFYQYNLPFLFLLVILTIGSNQILIPIMGVSGAALATLITVVFYGIFLLAFIWFKIRVSPFSLAMLKVLGVFGAAIGINFLCPYMGNPIIDSLVRTIVLGSAVTVVVYKARVSEEVNVIIDKTLAKIKSLSKRKS